MSEWDTLKMILAQAEADEGAKRRVIRIKP